MIIELVMAVIVALIVYSIGHSQGQITCTKKFGRKVVTLYVSEDQLSNEFKGHTCHLFASKPTPVQDTPVRVIYEERL